MKDTRFRYGVRSILFECIFTPVGVVLGVWLAHKLNIRGNDGEVLIIAGVVGLVQVLAPSLRRKLLPFDQPSKSSLTPPLNAEFLFYLFMTPQNCDALVGDLEERYEQIFRKFGRRRANFWYWTQTLMSVGPIAWAWAKRVMMKPIVAVVTWALAKGLVGHDGWLAALVELWKRVRS